MPKHVEQHRIDDMQWSGSSSLSSFPSLRDDGKSPVLKTPLFYLTSVSAGNHEEDLYFVNNTDETLSFVAPFMLYKNVLDARVTFGDISDESMCKFALYADDIDDIYTDVLPKQAVRIDRIHIIYDSDYLLQWIIHLPFRVAGEYTTWRFNLVEKGAISRPYPMLWSDFSQPTGAPSTALNKFADMPIEPSVYVERCQVLEQLIQNYGANNAQLVIAINDVLYRYCMGWSAPYSESDIQAKEIAAELQYESPTSSDAVKMMIKKVYDLWFGDGFVKDVNDSACMEILEIYQAWHAAQ